MKHVADDFATVFEHERFRFYGNATVGHDLAHSELAEKYSGVVYATGCWNDRTLGIPGEEYATKARDVVEWFNGFPDTPNLSLENVKRIGIIGNGNVALDIARVLTSPLDRLKPTDISLRAFNELSKNQPHSIDIIGRRGPLQAACTSGELQTLVRLQKQVIAEDFEVCLDED
jgi:NADPH-dependent glutamate synthase beta subunit-like oxidoreductase